jgi:CheY-like chemotaxis protein
MNNSFNILVVDDEQDVQWLFRQRFRREVKAGQLSLQFAFSGKEALDYLQQGGAAHVVTVLSDINMPGMTGLELLQKIKTAYPDLKVIMITAYSDEYNYQTALASGADDYFTKPIDFSTLKRKITSV